MFTLPINRELFQEVGKISQPCAGQALSCEWQHPETLEFLESGCAVTGENVDMGSGIVGTQCTCSHLTVFAIVLREEMQLAPLCQAQEVDYVLIALYAVLAACLLVQLAKLVFYKLSKQQTFQHALLLIASVLRILYLVVKPVIASLAGLVALGLFPSAIALTLFIYLLLVWASLQQASFTTSPFSPFRIPFVLVTVLVCLGMLAIVVLVAVPFGDTPEAQQRNQQAIVMDGSYALAALYAVVCVLVLLSGLGLRRSLGDKTGSSGSAAEWRRLFLNRVLIATLALSVSLFVGACLWVAAVQTDILASSEATLGTTASFFVVDWLSLCVMTWLFSKAVGDATRKSRRKNGNSDLSMSEPTR